MKIITEIHEIKAVRSAESIGFVPTMGNLHAGHAHLLQRSRQENAVSVLSVFINPTQFNDSKDFKNYPKTLDDDKKIAADNGVDYLFLPTEKLLYPNGYTYKITENTISSQLEGKHRPGHFDGVLTVVMKLLQLIQPNNAYFGEKDYQQLQLIKGLVKEFFLPTNIIGCETVRDANGLAYSSRNNRLSLERQQFAAQFPALLKSHQDCNAIKEKLSSLGFSVDYIEEYQQRRYGAVFLEGVRLIDNLDLSATNPYAAEK